jgi:hypothetical protein
MLYLFLNNFPSNDHYVNILKVKLNKYIFYPQLCIIYNSYYFYTIFDDMNDNNQIYHLGDAVWYHYQISHDMNQEF